MEAPRAHVIGRTLTAAAGGLDGRFWRLWSASAASNLSDGILSIAIPLLAISLTTSPVLVAGVTIASRLPWLLFALVAGALADRLDRRVTMAAVQLGRVLLLGGLALAVVLGAASIALLYAVVFLLGVLETLFDTTAQAMLPNVVGRERLTTANGRLQAVELTMNQFVGPPLGGFLVALAVAAAIGTTAVAYFGAALTILSVTGSFRAVRQGPAVSIVAEIRDGLSYLFGHQLLRTLAIVIGVVNLANGAFWAIFVLYAVAPGPMGLSEVGFGLVLTAAAVGSVGGTFLAPVAERRLGKANVLAVAVIALAGAYAVIAVAPQPIVVAAVLAIAHGVLTVFNVAYISFRQRVVPDRLRGRVIASFRVVSFGTLPLGALLGGVIGEAAGLPVVFVAAAVFVIAVLPARLLITDARMDAAERAFDGSGTP